MASPADVRSDANCHLTHVDDTRLLCSTLVFWGVFPSLRIVYIIIKLYFAAQLNNDASISVCSL
jgi:hypothetical protein